MACTLCIVQTTAGRLALPEEEQLGLCLSDSLYHQGEPPRSLLPPHCQTVIDVDCRIVMTLSQFPFYGSQRPQRQEVSECPD